MKLFTSYKKQIMIAFSFVQFNKYFHCTSKCTFQLGFALFNGTFHLSPRENICAIALINIHYLYNIFSYNFYKDSCPLIGWIAFIISTIYQVTKHPIANRLGRQTCKTYLQLHSAFTFSRRVFSISNTIFWRLLLGWGWQERSNAKLYARKLQQAHCVV